MTTAGEGIQGRYAHLVGALAGALEKDDESAFLHALDEMTRLREDSLLGELGEVTHHIEAALERFCNDTRLADLAEKEVPDARVRLEHVLKMTDEAAHHTMDLVERAYVPAERTSRQVAQLTTLWQDFRADTACRALNNYQALRDTLDAFLENAPDDAAQVQNNLKEVILAQGYQDLSGQIIRSVMKLIVELESALVSLVQLSRGCADGCTEARTAPAAGNVQGYGPVVPQVNDSNTVSDQNDIDALLSNLNI
jgi:chemotaxis protein CheZ